MILEANSISSFVYTFLLGFSGFLIFIEAAFIFLTGSFFTDLVSVHFVLRD